MTGTITMAHVQRLGIPPGGQIRVPGLPDRVRFEATSLVGLALRDCLGAEVTFRDLATATGIEAVDVRPVRNGGQ